jgi:hypothetical protein
MSSTLFIYVILIGFSISIDTNISGVGKLEIHTKFDSGNQKGG